VRASSASFKNFELQSISLPNSPNCRPGAFIHTILSPIAPDASRATSSKISPPKSQTLMAEYRSPYGFDSFQPTLPQNHFSAPLQAASEQNGDEDSDEWEYEYSTTETEVCPPCNYRINWHTRYYNVPLQMGNHQAPEGVAEHSGPRFLDYNDPFKLSWSAGDVQLLLKAHNCSFELGHFVIL
jgi:hypothetical protein